MKMEGEENLISFNFLFILIEIRVTFSQNYIHLSLPKLHFFSNSVNVLWSRKLFSRTIFLINVDLNCWDTVSFRIVLPKQV